MANHLKIAITCLFLFGCPSWSAVRFSSEQFARLLLTENSTEVQLLLDEQANLESSDQLSCFVFNNSLTDQPPIELRYLDDWKVVIETNIKQWKRPSRPVVLFCGVRRGQSLLDWTRQPLLINVETGVCPLVAPSSPTVPPADSPNTAAVLWPEFQITSSSRIGVWLFSEQLELFDCSLSEFQPTDWNLTQSSGPPCPTASARRDRMPPSADLTTMAPSNASTSNTTDNSTSTTSPVMNTTTISPLLAQAASTTAGASAGLLNTSWILTHPQDSRRADTSFLEYSISTSVPIESPSYLVMKCCHQTTGDSVRAVIALNVPSKENLDGFENSTVKYSGYLRRPDLIGSCTCSSLEGVCEEACSCDPDCSVQDFLCSRNASTTGKHSRFWELFGCVETSNSAYLGSFFNVTGASLLNKQLSADRTTLAGQIGTGQRESLAEVIGYKFGLPVLVRRLEQTGSQLALLTLPLTMPTLSGKGEVVRYLVNTDWSASQINVNCLNNSMVDEFFCQHELLSQPQVHSSAVPTTLIRLCFQSELNLFELRLLRVFMLFPCFPVCILNLPLSSGLFEVCPYFGFDGSFVDCLRSEVGDVWDNCSAELALMQCYRPLRTVHWIVWQADQVLQMFTAELLTRPPSSWRFTESVQFIHESQLVKSINSSAFPAFVASQPMPQVANETVSTSRLLRYSANDVVYAAPLSTSLSARPFSIRSLDCSGLGQRDVPVRFGESLTFSCDIEIRSEDFDDCSKLNETLLRQLESGLWPFVGDDSFYLARGSVVSSDRHSADWMLVRRISSNQASDLADFGQDFALPENASLNEDPRKLFRPQDYLIGYCPRTVRAIYLDLVYDRHGRVFIVGALRLGIQLLPHLEKGPELGDLRLPCYINDWSQELCHDGGIGEKVKLSFKYGVRFHPISLDELEKRRTSASYFLRENYVSWSDELNSWFSPWTNQLLDPAERLEKLLYGLMVLIALFGIFLLSIPPWNLLSF